MPRDITENEVRSLLEEFMKENPNGDSFELARFMYAKGLEKGSDEACAMF